MSMLPLTAQRRRTVGFTRQVRSASEAMGRDAHVSWFGAYRWLNGGYRYLPETTGTTACMGMAHLIAPDHLTRKDGLWALLIRQIRLLL